MMHKKLFLFVLFAFSILYADDYPTDPSKISVSI